MIGGKPNKTYKAEGADEGTANSFTKESGAVYTWTTYLEAPEDGEYSLVLEGIGGSIAGKVEVSEEERKLWTCKYQSGNAVAVRQLH